MTMPLVPARAPDALSATLSALSDPTRRAILARLSQGEATVNELAAPFAMSLPAISRHLKVLERAGLIARGRAAQWRPCRLEPEPLRAVFEWLEDYRGLCDREFGQIDARPLELREGDPMEATTESRREDRVEPGAGNGIGDGIGDGAAERAGHWLDLSRHFDAPRGLVFTAWSDGIHLRRWCAPAGFTVTDGGGDFREGGAWHAELTRDDGTVLRAEGDYLEIEPGRRIVHSHRWAVAEGVVPGASGRERRLEVTLSDEGEGTRLGLRMGPFEERTKRDGHRSGWTESFEGLDAYLPEMIAANPAPADEPVIRLVRVYPYPPARVWKAWADPGHIGHWWGPDGFTTTTHSFNFREEGCWHFTMHGPDGIDYPNRIRFVTVDEPRHLAYHHQGEDEADDSVFDTDVTLASVAGGTRVTLTMRFISVEVRNNVARTFGAIEGGQRTLARLGARLEIAA